MTDFTTEKRIVLEFYKELDGADAQRIPTVLGHYYASNHIWRGFHPFNEQHGADPVAQNFWIPLRSALKHMQRRMDIFFAGTNEIDGYESTWVVSMGHLMGLFVTS